MAFKHEYAKGRGNAYDDFGNLTSKGLLGGTQNGDGIGERIKAFFKRGKKTGGHVTGRTTKLKEGHENPHISEKILYKDKPIINPAITKK